MADRIKRFLRLPEVLQARKVSKSKHYLDMRDGRFPRPMKPSARISIWAEDDVIAEQQQLLAERDGKVAR